MNIQREVLRYVFNKGEQATIKEIADSVGLEKMQVYRAIDHLIQRKLVKVESHPIPNPNGGGNCKPPIPMIKIRYNEGNLYKIRKVLAVQDG